MRAQTTIIRSDRPIYTRPLRARPLEISAGGAGGLVKDRIYHQIVIVSVVFLKNPWALPTYGGSVVPENAPIKNNSMGHCKKQALELIGIVIEI
jgi:hypothetical protein